MNQNWSYSLDTLNLGQSQRFFVSSELEIRHMASKNNREPLLMLLQVWYIIAKPWMNSNWSYSRETTNLGQNQWVLSCVTLKFDNDFEERISEGFDSCDWPSNFSQIGFKSSIFSPCDLEIWWWPDLEKPLGTSFILCQAFASFQIDRWIQTGVIRETLNSGWNWWYFVSCASLQSREWIQTGVTVRKRTIRIKIGNFFVPCDLEMWPMTLKINRAPLLCCFKLCASFHSHQWIQTRVAVRKRPIWVKIDDFLALVPWNLTDDLENNRAPLLSSLKLCASFHDHIWIQTGVAVRKCAIWVKIDGVFFSRVTLKFDLWPWSFAWTSLLPLVITLENFIMIRGWEHGQKGRMDGRTEPYIELLGRS